VVAVGWLVLSACAPESPPQTAANATTPPTSTPSTTTPSTAAAAPTDTPPPSAAPPDPSALYQTPSPDLVRLADAPSPVHVLAGPDDDTLLLGVTPPLIPIAEVAQPERKLAGLRFNPVNNGETRSAYYSTLSFLDVPSGTERPVTGVPADGRIRQPSWSPDGKRVAFTVTRPTRVELWMTDKSGGDAHRVGDLAINGAHPWRACEWLGDSSALVCRVVPADRGPAPAGSEVPVGPLVEESLGRKSPAPTFEDLLHDEHDSALFEHYFTSEVWLVGVDGKERRLGERALVIGVEPSPDATSVLVTSLRRPFSYHVTEERFPRRSDVWSLDGKVVANIADLPLADDVPIDYDAVRTGRRDIDWRQDAGATLFWVEARDGGNPRTQAAVRDEMFTLAAPFTGAPTRVLQMPLRFHDAFWSSGHLAIVHDRWWKTRHEDEWRIAPDAATTPPQKLGDRSYEDRYADPGELQTRQTPRGTWVLWTDAAEGHVIRVGDGASPDGDRPFVDDLDLKTLKATRRWRSEAPKYEYPLAILGDGKRVISRVESPTEPPNLFVRDLSAGTLRALTHEPHPYPELLTVKRELIHYKRYDGLALSGTLYTPPGYDGKTRLPVLMWAYPQEFKAAKAAGQVQGSPYRFPRVSGGSPLFWLEHGFAILDNPAFPIVGEGKAEPNDTYVKQLVGDASAAVDELVRRGVGDRDRMAIGGHSYGAFTTANLLAHSRLFRAGIARSGAYNRTLTPFSFQSEERTFWEATPTYVEMSPFTHANTIEDPLLLVHGMEDNNQGTFPIQSERFFAALQGLGKTVRLVRLPHEAHGYRARESVLHMLWEMDHWLDKYVKNAPPRTEPAKGAPARAAKVAKASP
jgi:dipeptidyl aminopeptidase/acylaminoacyl peptidase